MKLRCLPSSIISTWKAFDFTDFWGPVDLFLISEIYLRIITSDYWSAWWIGWGIQELRYLLVDCRDYAYQWMEQYRFMDVSNIWTVSFLDKKQQFVWMLRTDNLEWRTWNSALEDCSGKIYIDKCRQKWEWNCWNWNTKMCF